MVKKGLSVAKGWVEEQFNFPVDFQKEIIRSLFFDKKLFINIGLMISPKCFDTIGLQTLYRNTIEYYNKYNNIPSYEEALKINEGIDRDIVDEIYEKTNLPSSTIKHVEDTIKDFIQCQSLKKAILESIDNLGSIDKHNEIKNKIENALTITTDIEELGVDAYKRENVLDRIKKLKDNNFIPRKPLNFPTLDNILDGGLANGEIFSFIGPSHSGKSMFLVNVGYNMILQKFNVVHITLEMSSSSTIQRYDMRMLGTDKNHMCSKDTINKIKDLYRDNNEELNKIKKTYSDHIGRLIVKKFPAKKTSPNDIDIYLKRLESVNDFKIDVLIIDYADIMSSDSKYNEKRHMLEDIYFDLKTIGEKWNIPVVTATQMNRGAIQKQTDGTILTEEHIAESYAVYMALDAAVTINTTPVERANNRCTIYVAKNRGGCMGSTIPMYVDYGKSLVREWTNDDGFFNKGKD